jgi:hypothetical protein
MPKGLVFKLRLDLHDQERLGVVAADMATSRAGAVRILVKQRYDELQVRGADRDRVHGEHAIVLRVIAEWCHAGARGVSYVDLQSANGQRSLDRLRGEYPDARLGPKPGRPLNELARWGYLRRLPGKCYAPTPKGRMWILQNVRRHPQERRGPS